MKKHLLILVSILAFSCSSDSNSGPDKLALGLVTGIDCRQNADDAPLRLGNPNTLVNGQFVIYPNPAADFIYFAGQDIITDIWIVAAHPNKIYQDVHFGDVLTNTLYTEEYLTGNSVGHTSNNSNDIAFEVADFAPGYYRVFVKMNGTIYWDNFYKYQTGSDTEAQFAAISNFWN